MRVIERKPVPLYEIECPECQSILQYIASEVSFCHITCPVCGISLWANTCCPVTYKNEEKNE